MTGKKLKRKKGKQAQSKNLRKEFIKRMKHEKGSIAEMKEIKTATSKIPTIREVSGYIDKKTVLPYPNSFTKIPSKQDTFKMYRHFLKSKGLTDKQLIDSIISVSDRVMKDRVRAYGYAKNSKGEIILRFTAYGIEPDKTERIMRILQSSTTVVDGARAENPYYILIENCKALSSHKISSGTVRSFKYQVYENADNYNIKDFEVVYDFA